MSKVRFAPSPTGYLHIGGARTCLFAWLYARHTAKGFVLRIEDTDMVRSKKEYLQEILESLQWLGLDWDDIEYQSERFDIYRDYANKLIEQGKAYKKDGAVFIKYDVQEVRINDLIRGEIVFQELPKQEDVIIKSDGSPTYNFCCVIDDSLMDIDPVVRGEDHISNTPKQILMYRAMDFKVPSFAHLPLIMAEGGGRMSKRFGATAISEYRKLGYLPEAIVNYLLLLGWSPGDDREIFSLKEASELFDIKRINKTSAAFSFDKLNWINGEYIRKMSLDELCERLLSFYAADNPEFHDCPMDYFKRVVELFHVRLVTLSEFMDKSRFCFCDDFVYNNNAAEVLDNKLSKEITLLIARLKDLTVFDKALVETVFRQVVDEAGIKTKFLVHPVRVALTGDKIGPGLFEMMEVLGKEKVLDRLTRLLKYWEVKNV
ncbi:MAG: glutamate--tRNA ligase [Candidatus Omnitrophica bacterium]|nr:glutamate--tRNA ligase [Candidatus Omnitrophota bacterium]MDD5081647.1 glutamate--tRNA ligase [Candidatus Omnitrophota bacterium]MDD5441600.1 glutamate--tRNA ligase [Candidatus Omnitrophota bacterium]